jgi:predicted nuclease of predicted toxin-antitoxin system
MTAFRIKLDENLGQSHAALLRGAGYEVNCVTDEGLSGTADADLWPFVCREGRFLITLDLDFSDVRQFVPGSHPGILLLRPNSHSRDAASAVLTRVLSEIPLQTLAGCLAIADERRTRIRRPAP